MKKHTCRFCDKELSKDEIALNKKYFGRKIVKYMCLTCIADNLDCTEDDLQIKIEEFREQGCTLFS